MVNKTPISPELVKFDELSINNIICFNLLKILKEPYFIILNFLSQKRITSADLVAIRNSIRLDITEKKLKIKMKRLINLQLVKEDDIKNVYSTTILGKKIIEFFHENELELKNLPSMAHFLRNITKIIILSRLSFEKNWMSNIDLIEEYGDLGSNSQTRQILNYLVNKNLIKKNRSTKTYKISPIGQNFIQFYWSLYEFYTTEYENSLLAGKPNEAAQISFSPFWTNFNFSSLNSLNSFLLMSRVIQDTSLSKGILRAYLKVTNQKNNDLIKALVNFKILNMTEDKIVVLDSNQYFFWNFQKISQNWNIDQTVSSSKLSKTAKHSS